MTAMETLTHLVELKHAATDIDALDRYVATLYRATATWTQGTTHIGVAALHYDALIDTIAHEQAQEATGADLRAEHAPDGDQWQVGDSSPAERRTA